MAMYPDRKDFFFPTAILVHIYRKYEYVTMCNVLVFTDYDTVLHQNFTESDFLLHKISLNLCRFKLTLSDLAVRFPEILMWSYGRGSPISCSWTAFLIYPIEMA
jgi:hypothetical protein